MSLTASALPKTLPVGGRAYRGGCLHRVGLMDSSAEDVLASLTANIEYLVIQKPLVNATDWGAMVETRQAHIWGSLISNVDQKRKISKQGNVNKKRQ